MYLKAPLSLVACMSLRRVRQVRIHSSLSPSLYIFVQGQGSFIVVNQVTVQIKAQRFRHTSTHLRYPINKNKGYVSVNRETGMSKVLSIM